MKDALKDFRKEVKVVIDYYAADYQDLTHKERRGLNRLKRKFSELAGSSDFRSMHQLFIAADEFLDSIGEQGCDEFFGLYALANELNFPET